MRGQVAGWHLFLYCFWTGWWRKKRGRSVVVLLMVEKEEKKKKPKSTETSSQLSILPLLSFLTLGQSILLACVSVCGRVQ